MLIQNNQGVSLVSEPSELLESPALSEQSVLPKLSALSEQSALPKPSEQAQKISFGRLRDLRRLFGFPLFIAWHFCTFYSCVLIDNLSLVKSSERYWAVALAATVLVSLLFILSPRFRLGVTSGFALRYLGAGAATVGTALLSYAFLGTTVSIGTLVVGGAISGVGMCILIVTWKEVLSGYDSAVVELVIPASFLAAIVMYLPVVYFKNLSSIIVVMLLPLISVIIANLPRKKSGTKEHLAQNTPMNKTLTARITQLKTVKESGLMGTAAIFATLWFCFALFRTFATPNYPSNRFTHYLLAFVSGLLIVLAIAVLTIRFAKSLDLLMALRLSVPLACLSFALIGVLEGAFREIAYAIGFSAVILMQLFLWISAAKVDDSKKAPTEIRVFVSLIAIGLGTCLGVAVGFFIQRQPPESPLFAVLPFVMTLLICSIMLFWRQAEKAIEPVYEPDDPESSVSERTPISPENMTRIFDGIIQAKALYMAETYSLTSREMEVLEYMLAGRSRPFIRDKLSLSLNTVNTYIKRIYQKANVHSQQELLDKAQAETSNQP